jgi:hypothetical protein
MALGVAIEAPGILSYLYRRYMFDEIKVEMEGPAKEFEARAEMLMREAISRTFHSTLLHSAETAGLHGLYINREDALSSFSEFLVEEEHSILVVGSSLLGLLQSTDRAYDEARLVLRERKNAGAELQFLLTHPKMADLRARQENREFQGIGQEIMKSLHILKDEWKVPNEKVKLYLGTPTCFGIRTEKAMLLNFYPYMREAYASPCLIVIKGGYFYEHFYNSHFKAWQSALSTPVPADLDSLSGQLGQFENDIRKLMGIPRAE